MAFALTCVAALLAWYLGVALVFACRARARDLAEAASAHPETLGVRSWIIAAVTTPVRELDGDAINHRPQSR